MLSPAIRLEPNVPDFQFCLAMCAGRKVVIFVNATKNATETSVLSMHCAGTQDATYATWSHLDHTCTYVMNMIAQFLAALQPALRENGE